MTVTEKIIDVMIVIDADTIVSDLGTNTDPNNPVQVTTADRIFMITKQDEAVSGQAGTELNVKANTMDVIRWRATSLTLNAAYDVILYKYVATGGGNLISPPTPLEADVTTPLPNPADPTKPTTQTIKNYFWQTTVEAAGSVTYHFQFIILDREGNIQGYYWWDPYITIST